MSPSESSPEPTVGKNNIQASKPTIMPESISLNKWEDSGFEWVGEVSPTSFERLAKSLNDEHPQKNINFDTTLYRRSNVLHLGFTVAGEVWLTCQRCLQPVAVELSDTYNIALLDDDSQISLISEEQDYLLLDEIIDEQTPERWLPFKKVIEDEILLKAPLAPKHEDCEMGVDQFGEIPEEEDDENPFAALAALKGKL